MSKPIKIMTVASAVTAAVSWTVFAAFDTALPMAAELFFLYAAMISAAIFVCSAVICIVKKLNGRASPYRVFAIVDALLGAAVAAYGVYDILTDTGWFAGILGTILLIYVVPIALVLLVVDLLVWLYWEKWRKAAD